jgi:hypothetical protein
MRAAEAGPGAAASKQGETGVAAGAEAEAGAKAGAVPSAAADGIFAAGAGVAVGIETEAAGPTGLGTAAGKVGPGEEVLMVAEVGVGVGGAVGAGVCHLTAAETTAESGSTARMLLLLQVLQLGEVI